MNNPLKKEKIPLRNVIQNNLYVLKYCFSMDRKLILLYFLNDIITTVGFTSFWTLILKFVIDGIMAKKTLDEMMQIVSIGIVVILILQIINDITRQYFETKSHYLTGKIQRTFIQKASNMDLICYDNPEYFDDFVIAASQSDEMLNLCIVSISTLLSATLGILALGGIIFSISPVIAIFPVVGFFVNLYTRFKIIKTEYERDIEKKKIERKMDYSKRVFYQPEYAKEIKLSEISVPLHRQLDESVVELRQVAKKYGLKIAIYSLINWTVVFTFLSFFCIPVYLGYLALVTKQIALGDVSAMNTAGNRVRGFLDKLNYTFANLQKVGLYTDRFRKFVEYEVNIEKTNGEIALPSELAEIEFKNVSFRYDGSAEYVLRNINITINPKEKIALVGHNGAGKTTLIKLLMRLYDVTEGEILYGGKNIKEYSIKEYRNRIGIVFQDFQIYAASIAENVRMDNTSSHTNSYHKTDDLAHVSSKYFDDCKVNSYIKEDTDDIIVNSLKKADFIKKLKTYSQGVNTELTREFSEEGTMLSGGEAQKIAIARMFAKPFHIAVLDEPSSALDPIAEYKLNQSMLEHAKEATIIFISHRLSTTKNADKIYMFEQGKVIEEGTHAQLIDLRGSYSKMFEKQAHYYIIGDMEADSNNAMYKRSEVL